MSSEAGPESRIADPFRAFRARDPVHWHRPSRAWLVTGYDGVAALLTDARLASETMGDTIAALPGLSAADRDELGAFFGRWMSLRDGQVHRDLRRSIGPVLAPDKVGRWRRHIEDSARVRTAQLDWARFESSFARPYARDVLRVVLGLSEAELDDVVVAKQALVRVLVPTPLQVDEALSAVAALRGMDELAGRLSHRTVTGLPEPLLHGVGLDAGLLTATLVQLVAGGIDPLANLLTSYGAHCRSGPVEAGLLSELFRLHSPFELLPRIALEALEVDGRPIEEGDRVLLGVRSAGLDESRFHDPLSAREDRLVKHFAFGGGRHRCPAAGLAELAVGVAVEALHADRASTMGAAQ